MKQLIQTIVTELEKEYWYPADPINLSIALAKSVIEKELEDQYYNALENLVDNIPYETEDKDWWSSDLKDAMRQAEILLENQLN
jgi:hypothetical protein